MLKVPKPRGHRVKQLLVFINSVLLLAVVVNGTLGALDARSHDAGTCGQGDMWAGVFVLHVVLVSLTLLTTAVTAVVERFRPTKRLGLLVLGDIVLIAVAVVCTVLIRQWDFAGCA